MRLMYLPANARYAFVFGDQLVPMGDYGILFSTRASAVAAAEQQGLTVDGRGYVKALGEMTSIAEEHETFDAARRWIAGEI